MDLSPFWLGLSSVLRKISSVPSFGKLENKGENNEQTVLKSGMPGMKHIAISDNKDNYFVLKLSKKNKLNI